MAKPVPIERIATGSDAKPEEMVLRAPSVFLAVAALLPLAMAIGRSADLRWIIICLTWLVCTGAIALKAVRRPVDKSDPYFLLLVGMTIMFSVHPAARITLDQVDDPYRGTFSIEPGLTQALVLGLLASAALVVGERLALGSQAVYVPMEATTGPNDARLFLRFGRVFLACGLVFLAINTVRSGVNPLSAVGGQGIRVNEATDSAYLYLAPHLLGPASLCYLYANHVRRRPAFMAWLICIIQALYYLPLGARLTLLTTVVPTFLAAAILARHRVKVGPMVIGGVLVLILLTSVRDLGSGSGISAVDSFQTNLTQPGNAFLELFTGSDTEMVDGLSLETQIVPSFLDYHPFSTVTNALAAPIPRSLWPEKPQTADGQLNYVLFGIKRNQAGVAYSLVGELYFDSGFFGVVAGFTTLGFAARRLTIRIHRSGYRAWVLLLAILGPIAVTLARGSLALTIGQTIYITAPIILVCYIGSRQFRSAPRASKLD